MLKNFVYYIVACFKLLHNISLFINFKIMAKKFYAQKDFLGFPIPGTMMSNVTVPASSVEIPTTTASVYKEHPQKLRYFVRLDKQGNILPNSLIISLKKPTGLVLEFRLPA
jgi:hypothetical protein